MLHTPPLTPPNSNPDASALARRSTQGFQTTLSAPLAVGGQIASLASVSGLSTDTAVTLVIDPGLSTQETVIGWVNGLNIINMARAAEGNNGAHAQNAIVVDYITAMWANSIVDFLLTDHTFDGHHHPSFLVGEIKMWPAAALPDTNWAVCDGSSLVRASYPDLFDVLGTLYGNVDSNTFNLPNYKGKTLVGQDVGQSEFATIGETGGEKTHILTTNEMPSHNHAILSEFGTNANLNSGVPGQYNQIHASGGYPGNATQNTGGGAAHNNLQPYAVANIIMRVLP